MRTYVSKMLVGAGIVVGSPTVGQVAVAPWGAIVALLAAGTALPAAAASDEFGFVKRIADVDSNATYVTAGPFDTASAKVNDNQAKAAVKQKYTVTIDVTGWTAGEVKLIKVAYHDNMSIIPNQIKFTSVGVVYAGETATAFATKVAAEFNKQDYLFVAVTSAAAVVTIESLVVSTMTRYNGIDKPEVIFFEIGTPETGFTVAQTVAGVIPQGTAAQIAWMEDQHMGRRGYSDRTSWNDGKKYITQAVAGTVYDVLVVEANKIVEGDMQDNRSNPIGAVIALPNTASSITALGTIGVTAVVIS